MIIDYKGLAFMIYKWNLKIHILSLIIITHLRFRQQGINN